MKLKFKKQQYQIDAESAAAHCFLPTVTDTNAMTNCDEILKKNEQEMRLF